MGFHLILPTQIMNHGFKNKTLIYMICNKQVGPSQWDVTDEHGETTNHEILHI